MGAAGLGQGRRSASSAAAAEPPIPYPAISRSLALPKSGHATGLSKPKFNPQAARW